MIPSVQSDWRDLFESAKESLAGDNQSEAVSQLLSDDEVIEGLKEALESGAEKAVAYLGKQGGYFDDAAVKILVPEDLKRVTSALRKMGQEQLVDEFEETINRAAEQAVPEALSIFGDAISGMSVEDAMGILKGGDTAATDYFRDHTSEKISAALFPLIEKSTESAGVTGAYKSMVEQVGFLSSFIDMDGLDLDKYVTRQAMDGLFLKIAEEERLIRSDPVARTTDILKKVFKDSISE
jgi:hypothetical protein